jgi:hypothetical protein
MKIPNNTKQIKSNEMKYNTEQNRTAKRTIVSLIVSSSGLAGFSANICFQAPKLDIPSLFDGIVDMRRD